MLTLLLRAFIADSYLALSTIIVASFLYVLFHLNHLKVGADIMIQRAPYQVNNNYMSKKSRCVELNFGLLARRQASKVFMLTILNQKLIPCMLKRRMKLRVRQGISVLKMFEIWF
ncbi:hypothetical protein DCAR_0522106 [Daucus carota subsp. sativus]|uniref:Uncharacterized protein n=1 Tax=Daucus carota subsp. sativus TaxID=79200 RepID=A0A164ZL75_DAUCS|nr:hypothetical protein DCAR_0522106 [Daucus carota subsp. sativus]